MQEINKSHQFAIHEFARMCKDVIGIKPLEDDKLVLNAACDFNAYIKTFKRLDHSVYWHRHFIDTLVKTKVDTLSKRITQEYGSHKRYIDRVQRRHGPSRTAYQRNCVRTGTRTEESNPVSGDSNAER